jgi:hypothetical protein
MSTHDIPTTKHAKTPVKHLLSIHALTNCSLRNPFLLITIHFHGGCTPLPAAFDVSTCGRSDVFPISPKVLYFQYHERRI